MDNPETMATLSTQDTFKPAFTDLLN